MITRDRRNFLAQSSAVAAATILPVPNAGAEPPPEVTKIRLILDRAICFSPQYLAEDLLRLEGFSSIEYVKVAGDHGKGVGAGKADISMSAAPAVISTLDEGDPVVVLAGVHAGCYELFGNERIQSIRDLRGKKVAVSQLNRGDHIFISSIMAYVGMDPRKDIEWVPANERSGVPLFVEGKVDAVIGFPPEPQELRAKKIGHVVVNTAQDRPWSQYFCCMVIVRREFVQRYPVATKRVLRAILKASDICATQPERAAKQLVAKGYEPRYEIGLEVLKSLDYQRWRTFNPEDTLRFHALRLHEVGMIKSNPNKLIAQGTDWRFLNELKKELKA
jgi:NitT/TauT family transport system substrate-binding protein